MEMTCSLTVGKWQTRKNI